MTTQTNEIVNSKAGRTIETKSDPRRISVLEALEAKYNLPVSAFDWLAPIVQVLHTRLSTISNEDEGETGIVSIRSIPIIYSGSTRRFHPKYTSNLFVDLEDAVFLDIDEYDRIDLSYLASLLEEMAEDYRDSLAKNMDEDEYEDEAARDGHHETE